MHSGDPQLSSSTLESSLRDRYHQLVERGRALGAIRTDMPPDLVTNLSLTMSGRLDNWFMVHGRGASTRKLEQWAKSWAALFERAFAPSTRKVTKPSAVAKRRQKDRQRSQP